MKCPNCGFSYYKTKYGDWIRDRQGYDEFWKDRQLKIKLAIEDYLQLKNTDPKKYTLNFTANHNEADWFEVKATIQELRLTGFVHDYYL